MTSATNIRLYEPLHGSSIRLLSIKPGFPYESLECGFVTVADLSDAPPYDALSYVWGTNLCAEPITCNGKTTTVTQQLADALKRLRHYPGLESVVPWSSDHPLLSRKNAWKDFARNRHERRQDGARNEEVLLWVDALCINQEDAVERANQVKMMGKIYERAQRVTIWLGKENREPPGFISSPDSQTILPPNCTHLGSYGRVPIWLSFIAQALRNANGPFNKIAASTSSEDSTRRNAAYGFPPPTAPEWAVVREFFENTWFERVWVIQEAVLATKAIALIGDWEIDWAAIGRAAVWFRSTGYAIPAVLRYQLREVTNLLPVSKSASAWTLCSWPENSIPLLDLLHEFRTRLASNPVDKVYATFGMAKELRPMEEHGFHELVEPNYSTKTVLEVYRDTAKFLIIEHGNLAVLSHAGSSSTSSDWPSWVPDWRHGKASNALSTSSTASMYNTSANQPLAVGISDHINSLVIQGIEVDVVAECNDRLASYGFGYITYKEEIDFVRTAWILANRLFNDDSNVSVAKDRAAMLIQTLTAGLSNTGKPTNEDAEFLNDAHDWFQKHAPKLLPGRSLTQHLNWSLKQSPDSGRFHEVFVRACVDRRFFITHAGRMGIGPDVMRQGDVVTVLFGGKVPYLLRPVASGYKFLGECYVPNLMSGEAVEEWKHASGRQKLFELL